MATETKVKWTPGAMRAANSLVRVQDEGEFNGHVLYFRAGEYGKELDSWQSPTSAEGMQRYLSERLAEIISERTRDKELVDSLREFFTINGDEEYQAWCAKVKNLLTEIS